MDMCSAFSSKEFDIPNMMSNSNMKCPIRKGVNYYLNKLSSNSTNFPPLIPEGRWKLQLDYLYLHRYTAFSLEWYSGVEYPIIFG
ncbi:hypothetical protein ILUMI_23002 [Ignelater luminosus]|uniref:Uncharacterized protein n=1 Tax=Ignelater luminosus TaxID=2038154 RepID=A0A8K0CDB9_IGNLU|nr:hypothetical protein ILUMI_23002 [Ignelater luminosus]